MSDRAPHRNSLAWASRAAAGGVPDQARESYGPPPAGAAEQDPTEAAGQAAALTRLLDGNRRFLSGDVRHGHDVARARERAGSPRPCALVIGCIDSRVPPEAVFDQGIGDLLVVRTAGHVLDRAAFASVQLAVTEMGVPLIVVLGHEQCAAVKYAVDATHRGERPDGDLAFLVQQIASSLSKADEPSGADTHEAAVRAHVRSVVAALRALPDVTAAVAAGTLAVVGTWYGVTDGQVEVIVEPDHGPGARTR